MAKAIVKQAKKSKPAVVIERDGQTINEETLKRLERDISEIGSLMYSLLNHLREDTDHVQSMPMMEAAAEKAGYLADKALDMIGSGNAICGDFAGWMKWHSERREEARQKADAAQEGAR
jgi:hypothetical protein